MNVNRELSSLRRHGLLATVIVLASLACLGCGGKPPETKESPAAMIDKSFSDPGAATPTK